MWMPKMFDVPSFLLYCWMLCSSGLLQNYGRTALITASEKGYKGVAELLLENNADVDAKNVQSPLFCFVVGCSAHLDCYRTMDTQR